MPFRKIDCDLTEQLCELRHHIYESIIGINLFQLLCIIFVSAQELEVFPSFCGEEFDFEPSITIKVEP